MSSGILWFESAMTIDTLESHGTTRFLNNLTASGVATSPSGGRRKKNITYNVSTSVSFAALTSRRLLLAWNSLW